MRDNLGFALEGAWQVLAIGLLLGAGLPALFAVGIRSLATETGPGKAAAGVCFTAVVAGIGAGLFVILSAGGIA